MQGLNLQPFGQGLAQLWELLKQLRRVQAVGQQQAWVRQQQA